MIRPSLQARRKLIFLYLLRSSSALATSEPPLSSKQTSIITNFSPHGHITLRLATRMDVPDIQRCNLATLPENYSSNFYVNHLRQWPDLALVAEHVVEDESASNVTAGKNPFETFDPSKPQNEIIGYVLGKVEETEVSKPTMSLSSTFSSLSRSRVDDSDEYIGNYLLQRGKTEMLGHVTSLAVLPQFRRKGLAAQLMKQLHFHMEEGYNADGVGLHVRVSNVAARKLYCEGMGYGVVDVIRGYYQDGEDAFFMRKNFHQTERNDGEGTTMEKESNSSFGRFGLRRKKRNKNASESISNVWETGPLEYRLPKIIPLEQPAGNEKRKHTQHNNNTSMSSSRNTVNQEKNVVDDPSQDQVMTGSF
jgi:Acetyltransferases